MFFHEEHETADMMGCVMLFKQFDPGVMMIKTYAGPRADTVFMKTDDGWKAFDPPEDGQPPRPKTPMVRH